MFGGEFYFGMCLTDGYVVVIMVEAGGCVVQVIVSSSTLLIFRAVRIATEVLAVACR